MRSRRWFLRTSGLAVGVLGTSQFWLRPATAQSRPSTPLGAGPSRKVLVAVFQRGAADGLNIVVPFFEKRYYQLRPGIAIPAPGALRHLAARSTSMDGSPSTRRCSRSSRCGTPDNWA